MPATDQLFDLSYQELRRLAVAALRGERQGHTLQPTALVNEAYLRLRRDPSLRINDRGHFLGVAARAMRQVLVDHARRRNARKRSGQAVTLSEHLLRVEPSTVDVLALDQALDGLATIDPRRVKIVELRFFAGLECEEVAELLGISARTVIRQWRSSRAFLLRELSAEN